MNGFRMRKGQVGSGTIMALFGIVLSAVIVLATLQGFVDASVLGSDTYALNATNRGQQMFDNFMKMLPVAGTAIGGILIFAIARKAGFL